MRLSTGYHGRVCDDPGALFNIARAEETNSSQRDADVDGEICTHGGTDKTRAGHVDEDLLFIETWRQLVHEHGTETLSIAVLGLGGKVLWVVHVGQDGLVCLDGILGFKARVQV